MGGTGLLGFSYIPRQKLGMYWIQVRRATEKNGSVFFFQTWYTYKGWPKEDLYVKVTINSQ